jgi:cytochrome c oxidase cbb3-type subunit 3
MSGFWSGWIALITLTSLAALAWLLLSVYFSSSSSSRRRGESSAEEAVWDETLREGAHPAPMWWFYLLVALMVFSCLYLILYPGLGAFKGALEWTQYRQLAQSEAFYEKKYGAQRAQWKAAALSDLQNDEAAMQSAGRIFQNNCAACHGANAKGQANLFPDLTNGVWQWGGDDAQLLHTIGEGRRAQMPPWGAALGDDGVAEVAAYVIALSQGKGDDDAYAAGRQKYAQFCIACHGANGEGNVLLGAHNLADEVWLYGGDESAVRRSIADGRSGVMPPQKTRLDEMQIRLLAAWLQNQNGGE